MSPPDATTLLGGLSAEQFMRQHWQRKPLLVRQAWPGVQPPLTRLALFALAARDDVQARLVQRSGRGGWSLKHGPFKRRTLPPLSQAAWTLLVQGVDLHVQAAHQMLRAFNFVPSARLDDVMVSWASDGGGVGPHLDSYDVFLLQVQGRRRWRIGPARDKRLVAGLPLKILHHFAPRDEWLLEPGDMLYLPPQWAHDGVAEGECMTCSIGFRAPSRGELASELAQRLADDWIAEAPTARALYTDAGQGAARKVAAVPRALRTFARQALREALADTKALDRALGELLSEPKPQVWFAAREVDARDESATWVLARGTRMLHDEQHLFINGEAYDVGGSDAVVLKNLASTRVISAAQRRRLSIGARRQLRQWLYQGWLVCEEQLG